MVTSSKPTVLTQYPLAQKCIPVTLLLFKISRWILTTRFPFNNPNYIGSSVIRFRVSDPTKVEKFDVGYGGSGQAIDSQDDVGGGMQQLVDFGVGPSGDVWLTNNWEIGAAWYGQAPEALSTRGADQGVVVFFGMAKPLKTPLIGPPRQL
jgi:hypothetical protein